MSSPAEHGHVGIDCGSRFTRRCQRGGQSKWVLRWGTGRPASRGWIRAAGGCLRGWKRQSRRRKRAVVLRLHVAHFLRSASVHARYLVQRGVLASIDNRSVAALLSASGMQYASPVQARQMTSSAPQLPSRIPVGEFWRWRWWGARPRQRIPRENGVEENGGAVEHIGRGMSAAMDGCGDLEQRPTVCDM